MREIVVSPTRRGKAVGVPSLVAGLLTLAFAAHAAGLSPAWLGVEVPKGTPMAILRP